MDRIRDSFQQALFELEFYRPTVSEFRLLEGILEDARNVLSRIDRIIAENENFNG